MRVGRWVLALLEGACAVTVLLAATLLVFSVPFDALRVAYRNGDLTSTIVVLAGACVGWLGLRLWRSPRRPPVGLLAGGVCAVGLVAVLWWTTRPMAEENPAVPTPGTAPPAAPPTTGP
ncbi:hypothetical protein [Streptomyces sparsus]